MVLYILDKLQTLKVNGFSIAFCWIPSHVGIQGNEKADKKAKAGLNRVKLINYNFPYTDYIPKVKTYVRKKWQQRWDAKHLERSIKLHEIIPVIKPFYLNGLNRKDEVVIHRIRIGHTRLTHKHLMESLPIRRREPHCNFCYLDSLTIKHILIDCLHFANIRRNHYKARDMRDLFDRIPPRHIIAFLKEANLYNEI